MGPLLIQNQNLKGHSGAQLADPQRQLSKYFQSFFVLKFVLFSDMILKHKGNVPKMGSYGYNRLE